MRSSTLPRSQNTALVEQRDTTVCCYVNPTQQIQIVRITHSPSDWLERAVFPGKQLVFEAHVESEIEVHTYELVTATLSEKISCDRLVLSPTNPSTLRYRL